jgi:hypothetical protein
MRFFHILLQKLLSLAALAGGVILILWTADLPQAPQIRENVDKAIEFYSGLQVGQENYVRYVTGGFLALAGFIALLPVGSKRSTGNSIRFKGTHGPIKIELAPIEATLKKLLAKFPEVKKIDVKLHPEDRGRKVAIEAETSLIKTTASGTTEMADRLQQHIRSSAAQILGGDEISEVSLNIAHIDFEGDAELLFGSNLADDLLTAPSPIEIAHATRKAPVQIDDKVSIESVGEALPGSPLPNAHGDGYQGEDIPHVAEDDERAGTSDNDFTQEPPRHSSQNPQQ